MTIQELGTKLAEITKALGWNASPVYDRMDGLVGVVIGEALFVEMTVDPDAEIWAPAEPPVTEPRQ